jgi:hypothetical protein
MKLINRLAVLIIIIKKGNGRVLIYIDYWRLNSITIWDRDLLHYINDLIDNIHRFTYFIKLDLSSENL